MEPAAWHLPTGAGCLPMLAPLGGQLSYTPQLNNNILGTYPQGTTVQLFCSNGATVSAGASQAFCQFGQWQPMSLGQCLGGGLGLPGTGITPSPNFGIGTTPFGGGTTNLGGGGCLPAVVVPFGSGTVQYSQLQQGTFGGTYAAGTTATLQCPQGFPSGSQSSTCSNGIWTPPLGTCTGGNTGTFGNQFGGSTGTFGNQFGSTIAPGNAVNSCLFGLMAPLGASLQYSTGGTNGPFPAGTSAQVVCQQGLPQGQSNSVCMNGQWQPPILSGCLAQNAGGLPGGIGTGFVGTVNTGINTLNGGLNQLGIGTQCLLGMAPVLGGNIVYSSIGPPYPPGTSANLQCANGQLPSGTTTPQIGGTFPGSSGSSSSSTATCINGQWQPAQFVGQCFGATTGGFGAQTTFPPAGLGTTPFSPFSSQQQQQQQQLQQQPQCLLGIATLALNGRIQYSNGALLGPYQAGTTATLACNPGFVPNGQSTASCQNGQFQPAALGQCVQSSADQTWPPPPPSSTTTTSSTRSTAVTQGATTMNGTTITATFGNETTAAATCFELPQPLNARFVYSPMGLMPPYPIGATVTLVCVNGTQLTDGATVGRSAVCQRGGWAMLSLNTCMPSSTTNVNSSTVQQQQ
uniref:Sushi domain-containing protein n=1 Tax=Globodera rostochiensis TaxID=31243 RepID=A0A914HI03_GLORO